MKVELTEGEWLGVLNFLGEFPYIKVQPLIAKIGSQLQAQKDDQSPILKRSDLKPVS